MRLPRFAEVARRRPVALVAPGSTLVDRSVPENTAADQADTPHPAPCAAVEVALGDLPAEGAVEVSLSAADGTRLAARLDLADGRVELTTEIAGDNVGRTRTHRSRRHGRVATAPTALAVSLTGSRLAALVLEDGAWVGRAWVGLRDLLDVHDPAWTASLRSGWRWTGDGETPVEHWRAGGFGQLGLRDVRLVTEADGSPHVPDPGVVLLTATSAGPGFFDTAHTSVWRLDRTTLALTHLSDLFFTRPERPGVFGDHATHLVRLRSADGGRWLVATSTWGDFDPARPDAAVAVTVAESEEDLLTGRHVLTTRPLPLPVAGRSVGVWDPHLVRDGDRWLAGYVSARRFFAFHPVLAAGPALDALELVGAATDRRSTEGTTLLQVDGDWVVAASDGPDSRRHHRERYPVFALEPDADRRLVEVATLDAPYPSNIPWPTLVPPEPGGDERWLLVGFDGTPTGGDLLGYGTHGDLVILRAGS